MNNTQLFKIWADVPEASQKPITDGDLKGFVSICNVWRLEQLTTQFGICGVGWWVDVEKIWTEGGFVFSQIKLYYKTDDGKCNGVVGVGGSELDNGDAIKKAQTKAIAYACKMLGMGANIYKKNDTVEKQSKPTLKPKKPRSTRVKVELP